tara:strand:+ start:840 stop:1202 length:363 start_codon:yes stop_codon:yes gene_type:complete
MRKITIDSIRAFRNGNKFKRGNMEVVHYRVVPNLECGQRWQKETKENAHHPRTSELRLHGNVIATLSNDGMTISTCGWNTVTTRERLNGLPGVHVTQRNFELFLNGEPWDGQRTKVDLWL